MRIWPVMLVLIANGASAAPPPRLTRVGAGLVNGPGIWIESIARGGLRVDRASWRGDGGGPRVVVPRSYAREVRRDLEARVKDLVAGGRALEVIGCDEVTRVELADRRVEICPARAPRAARARFRAWFDRVSTAPQ